MVPRIKIKSNVVENWALRNSPIFLYWLIIFLLLFIYWDTSIRVKSEVKKYDLIIIDDHTIKLTNCDETLYLYLENAYSLREEKIIYIKQ